MDKWLAIAAMVIMASLFGSFAVQSYSKSQAQVACFKAAEEAAKATAIAGNRADLKIDCNL